LVIAEDTRVTGKLLSLLEIKKETLSMHKFNEHRRLDYVKSLLEEGKTIAYCSDAGTPGISDPGFLIVRECIRNEIPLEVLPGATAFIPALVASGLATERFVFEGFLPQKKGRQTRLKELANETRTMVFYESPYRLVKSLTELAQYLNPERLACVSREITKIYEENRRGTLTELAAHYAKTPPKGEIVLIVAGA
jgi:16S rRNA (cytidine1402-2'-O)-methyltransferase